MAGDWIRIETTLIRDTRIAVVASDLRYKDPDLALAKIIRVWAHADEHGQRCNDLQGGDDDVLIAGATFSILDKMTGVFGLLDAMRRVGWARETPDGVVLPGFLRHQPRLACERKAESRKNAERARNVRRTQSARAAHETGTIGARSPRAIGGPTEQNRTEQNKTAQDQPPPLPPAPPATAPGARATAAMPPRPSGGGGGGGGWGASRAGDGQPVRGTEDDRAVLVSTWNKFVVAGDPNRAALTASVNNCRTLWSVLGAIRQHVAPDSTPGEFDPLAWLLGRVETYAASRECREAPCSLRTFLCGSDRAGGGDPMAGKWLDDERKWDAPMVPLAARAMPGAKPARNSPEATAARRARMAAIAQGTDTTEVNHEP